MQYDPSIMLNKRIGRLIHERAVRPAMSPQKKNPVVGILFINVSLCLNN